jgi:WD40 repeat protein
MTKHSQSILAAAFLIACLATIPRLCAVERWQGKLATYSPGGRYLAYLDGDNGLRIVAERTTGAVIPSHLDQLFADLDSVKFHERNHAYRQLRLLGPEIKVEIEQRLVAPPSLEVEQRLKSLRQRFESSNAWRPKRRVRQLIFSPDDQYLALAGEDRTVMLWRTGSGQQESMIGSFDSTIYALAFSPDGEWLVIGTGNGRIYVCDIQRKVLIQELTGHTSAVMSLQFSADGKRLYSAGGFDQRIGVWDATELSDFRKASRRWLGWLTGHRDSVLCLAVSKDGRTMASGGYENVIHLWDLEESRPLKQLLGHSNAVRALCFTRDSSELVSGGDDGTVLIWDVRSHKALETIRAEVGAVQAISVKSGDRRLAISGDSNHVAQLRFGQAAGG